MFLYIKFLSSCVKVKHWCWKDSAHSSVAQRQLSSLRWLSGNAFRCGGRQIYIVLTLPINCIDQNADKQQDVWFLRWFTTLWGFFFLKKTWLQLFGLYISKKNHPTFIDWLIWLCSNVHLLEEWWIMLERLTISFTIRPKLQSPLNFITIGKLLTSFIYMCLIGLFKDLYILLS